MRIRFALAVGALGLASCGPQPPDDERAQASFGLTGQWQTGPSIGLGVAMMDTGNVLGENIFIGYAGYNINLGQAQNWVVTLYDARLRELGVRTLYAVQGPADSAYNGLEIGNSKIAAALGQQVTLGTGFVVIAGHSSGSFVADELLQQLESGADPSGAIGSRTVYFDLDGDQKYVSANGINRLRKAYYVNARNPVTGSNSYNYNAMNSLGATFAGKGGAFEYDASGSGCTGTFCTHISLINTHPHDPATGSGADYDDFGGRPVNQWWLDVKVAEAGLGQCATGFTTQGAIEFAYALLGGCGSVLGPLTTGELAAPDGIGRFNHFQVGSIYWTPGTGPHEVHGAIHSHWALLGWEAGALGYPTSNELETPDTLGRYSRFQHGAIYFTLLTGAHAVTGGIYDAWAAQGLETGPLGYPIADEHDHQVDFQHGSITLLSDGGTQVVLPTVDAGSQPDASVADAGDGLDPGPADAGAATAPARVVADAGSFTPLDAVTGGCSAAGGNGVGFLGLLALALLRSRNGKGLGGVAALPTIDRPTRGAPRAPGRAVLCGEGSERLGHSKGRGRRGRGSARRCPARVR